METLEQLKDIVDGAFDGDLFYDGRYLNKKLYVRCAVDKYSIKGVKTHTVYDAPLYVNTGKLRSLSEIKLIIELMETNKALMDKINQFDKAITDIGKHIQKSEPSFSMSGVDVGDSQKRIIDYIEKLECAK